MRKKTWTHLHQIWTQQGQEEEVTENTILNIGIIPCLYVDACYKTVSYNKS